MAAVIPKWTNVAAPNFGSSIVGLNQASRQITDSFGQLGNVFQDYAKRRQTLATNDAIKDLMIAAPDERKDLLRQYDSDSWVDSTAIFDTVSKMEQEERLAAQALRQETEFGWKQSDREKAEAESQALGNVLADQVVSDEEISNADPAIRPLLLQHKRDTETHQLNIQKSKLGIKADELGIQADTLSIAKTKYEADLGSWQTGLINHIKANKDPAEYSVRRPQYADYIGSGGDSGQVPVQDAVPAAGRGVEPSVLQANQNQGVTPGQPQNVAPEQVPATPAQENNPFTRAAQEELSVLAQSDPIEVQQRSGDVLQEAGQKDTRHQNADQAVASLRAAAAEPNEDVAKAYEDYGFNAIRQSPIMDVDADTPYRAQSAFAAYQQMEQRYGNVLDEDQLKILKKDLAVQTGIDVKNLDSSAAALKADLPEVSLNIAQEIGAEFGDISTQIEQAATVINQELDTIDQVLIGPENKMSVELNAKYLNAKEGIRKVDAAINGWLLESKIPLAEQKKIKDTIYAGMGLTEAKAKFDAAEARITSKKDTILTAKTAEVAKETTSSYEFLNTGTYGAFATHFEQNLDGAEAVLADAGTFFPVEPPPELAMAVFMEKGGSYNLGPDVAINPWDPIYIDRDKQRVKGRGSAAVLADEIYQRAKAINKKTVHGIKAIDNWLVDLENAGFTTDELDEEVKVALTPEEVKKADLKRDLKKQTGIEYTDRELKTIRRQQEEEEKEQRRRKGRNK